MVLRYTYTVISNRQQQYVFSSIREKSTWKKVQVKKTNSFFYALKKRQFRIPNYNNNTYYE